MIPTLRPTFKRMIFSSACVLIISALIMIFWAKPKLERIDANISAGSAKIAQLKQSNCKINLWLKNVSTDTLSMSHNKAPVNVEPSLKGLNYGLTLHKVADSLGIKSFKTVFVNRHCAGNPDTLLTGVQIWLFSKFKDRNFQVYIVDSMGNKNRITMLYDKATLSYRGNFEKSVEEAVTVDKMKDLQLFMKNIGFQIDSGEIKIKLSLKERFTSFTPFERTSHYKKFDKFEKGISLTDLR
jgi:hypothetical protein